MKRNQNIPPLTWDEQNDLLDCEKIDREISQKDLNILLFLAISLGKNIKKITELLQLGADPNGDGDGQMNTPMLVAVQTQDIECIKLLFRHGGNIFQPNFPDRSGTTGVPGKDPITCPFGYAVNIQDRMIKQKIVNILLENAPYLENKYYWGGDPHPFPESFKQLYPNKMIEAKEYKSPTLDDDQITFTTPLSPETQIGSPLSPSLSSESEKETPLSPTSSSSFLKTVYESPPFTTIRRFSWDFNLFRRNSLTNLVTNIFSGPSNDTVDTSSSQKSNNSPSNDTANPSSSQKSNKRKFDKAFDKKEEQFDDSERPTKKT